MTKEDQITLLRNLLVDLRMVVSFSCDRAGDFSRLYPDEYKLYETSDDKDYHNPWRESVRRLRDRIDIALRLSNEAK